MDVAKASKRVSDIATTIREIDRNRNVRKTENINVSELLELIIEEVGGAKKLARIFATQLNDPNSSPHTKKGLLDTISRLVAIETRRTGDEKKDESQLSDEDLDLELNRLMTEADGLPSTPET